MRKISYARFGGPEVLEVVEVEEPHAGPGQIRIAVRAAGVNAVDWRIREGQFETTATATHGATTLPAGVGIDAAGVVDEVGDGVADVRVGEAVFGKGTDTYAEFAVLDFWQPIPDGVSFEQAAGYPCVVETALRLLAEVGARPGHTLLVSGAAGGVGSAVVQVARARGIDVIGTAGAANQEYLRSLGATAITYDDGWVERARQAGPVHAALDLSGSGVIPQLVELTGDPQKVITIADLDAPNFGVRFSGVSGSMRDALVEGAALLAQGKLSIPVERTYSLDDAGSAHADSRAGHTRGRRVIVLM
jgi:NADPH:quinone reductase-like Zn-dependent oxidoreductase